MTWKINSHGEELWLLEDVCRFVLVCLWSVIEGKQDLSCGISLVPNVAFRGLKRGPLEGKTSVVKIIPFCYISCFLCFRNKHKRSEGLACAPWWSGLATPALCGCHSHIPLVCFMTNSARALDPVKIWSWKWRLTLLKEGQVSAINI